jgi:hypothetical protein
MALKKTGWLALILLATYLTACTAGDPVNSPLDSPVDITNYPPSISGNPLNSTRVEDAYSFVPTASDPDAGAIVQYPE